MNDSNISKISAIPHNLEANSSFSVNFHIPMTKYGDFVTWQHLQILFEKEGHAIGNEAIAVHKYVGNSCLPYSIANLNLGMKTQIEWLLFLQLSQHQSQILKAEISTKFAPCTQDKLHITLLEVALEIAWKWGCVHFVCNIFHLLGNGLCFTLFAIYFTCLEMGCVSLCLHIYEKVAF